MSKRKRNFIATLLVLATVIGIAMPVNRPLEVKAAEAETQQTTAQATPASMITGGDGKIQQTLSTGEKATIEVDDGKLKVTVDSHTYSFAGYLNVVDQATVSEDDFLHFCTFSHDYYLLDLRYGSFTLIHIYRNMTTWEYSMETAGSEPVRWDSLIDTKYYFQQLAMNKSSRERLVTRADFERLNPTKPDSTQEPTQPTQAPTAIPSMAPTQEPTPSVQPTQVPTAIPSIVPTQEPTQPTQNPSGNTSGQPTQTVTPNGQQGSVSGTIDVNWLLQQHINGLITWDRVVDLLGLYNYKADKVSTSTSTTYYFYDENGKLIKEETITTGTETTTGTGTITGNVADKGQATVSADVSEKGEATVNVNLTTTGNTSTSKASTATTKKVKPFYYMRAIKNHRQLMVKRPGVKAAAICSPYFNKKKGILKWDKNTYKNIKYVSFTSDSLQLFALTKANNILIIARAKSKNGIVYKARRLKGNWKVVSENRNLVARVSNGKGKVMTVGDLQPVKVKVKK